MSVVDWYDPHLDVWLDGTAYPFRDGLTVYFRDVTERRRAEDELRHQALHDSLTGLPNRSLLADRVEQGILQAQRAKTGLALLLLDLDRFKEINDTFGHQHGDEVLRQVAERLRQVLRTTDTVARLGGDEFAIVLPGGGDDALVVAHKIAQEMQRPVAVEGQSVHLGASIGVALYSAHGRDLATLLRQADVAMYVAKRSGGGVSVYAPDQDRYSRERIALTTELRRAVEQGQLVLHYQPILDLVGGAVSQVEALVRWDHPEQGLLFPDQFLPLAEEMGLMDALTRRVLGQAMRQGAIWQRRGDGMRISVNLSMANLGDERLVETVLSMLTRHNLSPSCIKVELTETAIMADQARSLALLTRLAEAGVSIAVDDFGTGYSSLAYLTRLPVNEIKIDKSFVRQLDGESADAVIVRSTIAMAHALGMRVVAEGVETEHARLLLREYGCDAIQGYVLSRPLPAAELEGWLARRDPCSAASLTMPSGDDAVTGTPPS